MILSSLLALLLILPIFSAFSTSSKDLVFKFQAGIAARSRQFSIWDAAGTDSYRVLHGSVEGLPGLMVDRYGPTLLFQTFREGLLDDYDFQQSTSRGAEESALAETLNDLAEMVTESAGLNSCLRPLLSHRGSMGSSDQRRRREYYSSLQAAVDEVYVRRHSVSAKHQLSESLVSQWGGGWGKPNYSPTALARENGLVFDCGLRPGQDPGFYLDFRVAREWLAENGGESVLNAFSYTSTAGIAAMAGSRERGVASKVVNLDFSASALAIGRVNANLNGFEDFGGAVVDASSGLQGDVTAALRAPLPSLSFVRADALPSLRQLAGLPAGGRRTSAAKSSSFQGRGRRPGGRGRGSAASSSNGGGGAVTMSPQQFDTVVLDPPTFASSPYGAVDIVRDYETLLKPSVLATKAGGTILATNHVSAVDRDEWLEMCSKCCAKAGRPLTADPIVLEPHCDFPAFEDGKNPLKIALLRV